MTDNTRPPSLTNSHLQQLKNAQHGNRQDAAAIGEELRKLPRKQREELFGGGLWWSWVYELTMIQHLGLLFASFGVVEDFARIMKGPGDKVQTLIDFANGFEPNSDAISKAFGPDADETLKALASSLLFGLMRQIECVETKGCYLSDLVAKVESGEDIGDVAFFNALHIDRTIVSCPTFGERITRAELEDDKEFFKSLANNLKKRWKKASPKKSDTHKDLRVFLLLAHEAGMLEAMSITEADKLFIRELSVYSDEGDDPVRGLQRFILRWKNKR